VGNEGVNEDENWGKERNRRAMVGYLEVESFEREEGGKEGRRITRRRFLANGRRGKSGEEGMREEWSVGGEREEEGGGGRGEKNELQSWS
jgi:hypothetical protein